MADHAELRHMGLTHGATAAASSPRNGVPLARPYHYRDRDAGREDEVQRILAGIRAQVYGEPDVEPGYEFRREARLAADEEPPALLEQDLNDSREEATVPVPRCDGCGYLVTRCCCPGGPRS